ncbi:MAG: hypothetical protein EZS28_036367 [Streblomastix strix]|uniref:Uncharacterized protein n=1 Tax=Streblomastix strix TaxID=222440 RepID=A0A5J4UD03_9EUKA|nr:MAG: hypothetical protein EZS28_036367 [Streblomastix strix]
MAGLLEVLLKPLLPSITYLADFLLNLSFVFCDRTSSVYGPWNTPSNLDSLSTCASDTDTTAASKTLNILPTKLSVSENKGKIQKKKTSYPEQKQKEIEQKKPYILVKKKLQSKHLTQFHFTSPNITYKQFATPNQHHFTFKSNPSSRLKRINIHEQQNSTQIPISPKLGQQIEAVCWERDSFDPAEDHNKAVCVGSMSPLTQRKMLREQDVGIRDPPILQQDVGIRDPPILQQIQMKEQGVGIRDPPILQQMKMDQQSVGSGIH